MEKRCRFSHRHSCEQFQILEALFFFLSTFSSWEKYSCFKNRQKITTFISAKRFLNWNRSCKSFSPLMQLSSTVPFLKIFFEISKIFVFFSTLLFCHYEVISEIDSQFFNFSRTQDRSPNPRFLFVQIFQRIGGGPLG